VYVDPADGRIDLLAHGADETFTQRDRPVDYAFGLIAQRCLADPECGWTWAQAVWSAEEALAEADLPAEVSAIAAQIALEVASDPHRTGSMARVEASQQQVVDFIRARADDLASMPGL